jgi:hypothetical protein
VRERSLGAWAAAAIACAVLVGTAHAQPYAADGGFDRPRLISRGQERPTAALALDAGIATWVRIDDGALVATPLAGGAARRLDDAEGVRWIAADGGVERPLVAVWHRRDPRTGQYVFSWTAGGELLRTVQPLEPVPVATDAAPLLFVVRGQGGEAVLERLDVGGTGTVLYRTDLRLSGLSAVADDADTVHLTWLEGRSEATPLGNRSSWTARAASWSVSTGLIGPVDLGAALGDAPPTTTDASDGRVDRTWVDDTGLGRRTAFDPAAALAPPTRTDALRGGRPVAALGTAAYVAEGGSVWRVRDGGATPVAWSPLVVAQAWAVRDVDGVTHLAWVGTEAGGQHALYASDDRTPMVRTWRDRLAARLGWSPWNLIEEAAGQAAASTLIAVLVAMVAAPLLWVASIVLAGRASAGRARWRGAVFGAALGPVAVAAALGAGVAGGTRWPLVGGPATMAIGTAVGLGLGGVAWARRDMEPAPAFVASGTTAVAVTAAVVAFVAFQRWLALTVI